jgi:regulator of replication initiation timing
MAAGKSVSSDIQITVPQDAPRTSLVAAFSERAQQSYYDYSSYYPYATAYYVNYSSPYYAYYCDPYYTNNNYCPYQYYYQYYPYSYTVYYGYPSSSYSTTTTDVGITSLPYIKATTPEAVTLQSQNEQLQQQLSQSQADNQKLQSDNQKLQQDLQNAQQTIAQQNSTANDMNQRLTSSNFLTYGLGALAAVFAILAVHFRRQRGRTSFLQQQYAQSGQTGTPGEQKPPSPTKEQPT